MGIHRLERAQKSNWAAAGIFLGLAAAIIIPQEIGAQPDQQRRDRSQTRDIEAIGDEQPWADVVYRLGLTAIEVTISEDHPLGLTVPTSDLETIVEEDGLGGLERRLSEFGQVELLARAEALVANGDSGVTDLGGDVPVVTRRVNPDGSEQVSSQAVREGLSFRFNTRTLSEDTVELGIRVELNDARVEERRDIEVVSRETSQWDTTVRLRRNGDTFIQRNIRTGGEKIRERLFVVTIEEMD